MLTYLDLVNDFITETGINGGQLVTSIGGGSLAPGTNIPGQGVSTFSAEVARITKWIADADYEIQSLHHDWKFLWRQYRGTLGVGQDFLGTPKTFGGTPPAGYVSTPYSLRKVDRESLCINYTSQTQAYRPAYLVWREFERLWQSRGAKYTNDYPSNWTVDPNGHPLISHASATGLPYQYECWIRPRRLSADGDISPLVLAVANNLTDTALPPYQPPVTLTTPSTSASLDANSPVITNVTATSTTRSESCRIIIVRAKIFMAELEGATDIMQSALAEYEDLLQALRADQLEGQEADRSSQSDIPLTIVSE